MSEFRIGFLRTESCFQFTEGAFHVLPEYAEVARSIHRCTCSDGFVYPALVIDRVNGQPKQGTERAACLFHLPASHRLTLDSRFDTQGDAREVAAFVMHFVGLLHGVWLQFEDWWFDRRVRVVPHRSFILTPDQVGQVLGCALRTWLAWEPTNRTRLANALYMHYRSPSYDWDWERFAIDYWVTDALWKTAKETGRIKANNGIKHAERIQHLCQELGLSKDRDRASSIVKLRNDLMHETLWDEGQPGTARSAITIDAPANLRRLNLRLFLAILGVRAGFVGTQWWHMGTWSFELGPNVA